MFDIQLKIFELSDKKKLIQVYINNKIRISSISDDLGISIDYIKKVMKPNSFGRSLLEFTNVSEKKILKRIAKLL